MIKKLWNKYKDQFWELFWYGIFGVLTTLINILVFAFFEKVLSWNYMVANIIAWIAGVVFAFVTNKLFVFKSKSWESKVWIPECISFTAARLATLVVDMVMMFVMVSVLNWDEIIAKVIANVVVIILNFVFSKLIVFKDKNKEAVQ